MFILGKFFGLNGGQNTLFAFALAQGGEFAFVLVAFSLENGVILGPMADMLLIVVALSMAVTPPAAVNERQSDSAPGCQGKE